MTLTCRCGVCSSKSSCGYCFMGDEFDILNSTCVATDKSSYDEVRKIYNPIFNVNKTQSLKKKFHQTIFISYKMEYIVTVFACFNDVQIIQDNYQHLYCKFEITRNNSELIVLEV